MSLASGTRLGPYEIVTAIGAGGMGEVYEGRDTRLKRRVAIKVLPVRLSDDAALRERFDREARTISSLSHPHICSLFDVGHQDGVDFLVLEYLEGETLHDRLARSHDLRLPLSEALTVGIEIAGALDAAHRAGVVHRDLKPANVMQSIRQVNCCSFETACCPRSHST
jgi:serine/threonine protein kinase